MNAELQTRARPRCFCTWTPPPQAQDGHGSAVPLQGLGAGQIRQARFHCRGGPPCPPARGTPSPPPVGGSAIRRRGKQARGYTCLLPLWLPAVSGSSGEPYRELEGTVVNPLALWRCSGAGVRCEGFGVGGPVRRAVARGMGHMGRMGPMAEKPESRITRHDARAPVPAQEDGTHGTGRLGDTLLGWPLLRMPHTLASSRNSTGRFRMTS